MDVRLSLEQRALRDSAVRVVDRLGPHAVGQLDDDERRAKLDAAVDAAGWRELRTATDDGAPWASAVEAALVAEELGRGLADTPFLGPTLAADLRRRAGAPAAAGPETIVLHHDLSGPASAADGALAAGALAIDALGASAALVLVPAPASASASGSPDDSGEPVGPGESGAPAAPGKPGGHVLALVDLPPAAALVDLTRPAAALPPSAPLVDLPGQARALGADDLTAWTALGLALTAADLVGTMRGAVGLATGYAKERHQYGRAIGSFQAVQHLLADAFVSTEGARSVALHAAWAVDALLPAEALAAAAVAKAYSARAARTVCETAIQVHGGIGNTWECLAHVHLRRALLSSDVLGGAGASLARVLDHHGIGNGTNGIGAARGLR
jgi:alkylation response protein AidB-like acyl-CoA dehydrogenase